MLSSRPVDILPPGPSGASDDGKTRPGDDAGDDVLAAAVALAGKRVVALTGAGISTESGIPDYRGPETRRRARQPMRFSEFTAGEENRRRYWARATLGYARVRDAAPNAGHRALAGVDVITQNVDGLHQRAGARGAVVELHGALREVVCLGCRAMCPRDEVHARLLAANERVLADVAGASGGGGGVGAVRPDGDLDVDAALVERFTVVDCEHCGGALKPRVVFFGENVAAAVLAEAWRVLDGAQALLVVGSSLEVFSGRRFVIEAHARKLPVIIVNRTATRADELATVCVRASAGRVLPMLFG